MKRKFLIHLAMAILTTVILISLFGITFFKIEFEQLVDQEKELIQKRIEKKIPEFASYLRLIEEKMEKTLSEFQVDLDKQYILSGGRSLAQIGKSLEGLQKKYEFKSLLLHNRQGKTVAILGENGEKQYFQDEPSFRSWSKQKKPQEILSHFQLMVEGQTGKKRKHSFITFPYSPYILEIVQSLRDFVKKNYCASYYEFLFKQYFQAFGENSPYLDRIDIFHAEAPFWSLLVEGRQLPGEIAGQLKGKAKLVKHYSNREDVLFPLILNGSGYQYLEKVFIQLQFKKNIFDVFSNKIGVVAALVGLLIFVLSLLIYSKVFDRYFLSRILMLRDKINQVGNGYYSGSLGLEGEDEISDMAGALNRMQLQIQNREKELNQANAAKLQFISNVNHELRTPMTPVIGMLQLLSQTELNKEQREYLEIIQISSQSLLRVIQNILDFSEIQKGEIHIEKVEFSLQQMLEETARESRVNAHKKKLEFELVFAKDLAAYYVGPVLQIKKILVQLFDNAVKFTEKGRILVEVSEVFRHEQEAELRIEIKDTGIGISEKNLTRIFEFFNQVDYSSTRRYGGLGIGLGIAKELLFMINGVLDISSEVDKGSSFILTLPLLISMTKQDQKKEAVAKKKLKILIAEDNLSNREMIKLLVEHKNWNFDVVQNGCQVIEKFKEESYDLILMDVQMPEMDGFETTRAIRKLELEGKYTPILAVTAFYMEGYEKLCKLSGMDGYLEKPVNTEKLYRLIEELIHLKR